MRKSSKILILCILTGSVVIAGFMAANHWKDIQPVASKDAVFEKAVGEVFIPLNSKYMLNLYVKLDGGLGKQGDEEGETPLAVSFGEPEISVADYSLTSIDPKHYLYEMTLYLNVDHEIHREVNEIEIDGVPYGVGSILVHSIENQDFEVVSVYALGKEFTQYKATLKNTSEKSVTISEIACGMFDGGVQSCTWGIDGVSYDTSSISEKEIGPGQEIAITLNLDKEAVPPENKVIFLAPKMKYAIDGQWKEYYLPYCTYNRLLR